MTSTRRSKFITYRTDNLKQLTPAQTTSYTEEWVDCLPMAILEAVYSIQARHSRTNNKGLFPRLRKFKEAHPKAAQDLRELLSLTAEEIKENLGYGKTAGPSKARVALQVARNLTELTPPVYTAEDFHYCNTNHEQACLGVYRLGKVTYGYLGMLLGHANSKTDD